MEHELPRSLAVQPRPLHPVWLSELSQRALRAAAACACRALRRAAADARRGHAAAAARRVAGRRRAVHPCCGAASVERPPAGGLHRAHLCAQPRHPVADHQPGVRLPAGLLPGAARRDGRLGAGDAARRHVLSGAAAGARRQGERAGLWRDPRRLPCAVHYAAQARPHHRRHLARRVRAGVERRSADHRRREPQCRPCLGVRRRRAAFASALRLHAAGNPGRSRLQRRVPAGGVGVAVPRHARPRPAADRAGVLRQAGHLARHAAGDGARSLCHVRYCAHSRDHALAGRARRPPRAAEAGAAVLDRDAVHQPDRGAGHDLARLRPLHRARQPGRPGGGGQGAHPHSERGRPRRHRRSRAVFRAPRRHVLEAGCARAGGGQVHLRRRQPPRRHARPARRSACRRHPPG